MLEDKLLVWKFNHGSADALRRIYAKYKNDLLALAVALSNDKAISEDAVHDVFVSFAELAGRLRIKTSLKSYLAAAVANRLRNIARSKAKRTVSLIDCDLQDSPANRPDRKLMLAELADQIETAINQLPDEQREVVILHTSAGVKFSEIAKASGVSINTIQSRYRYGLKKLRSILNGQVEI